MYRNIFIILLCFCEHNIYKSKKYKYLEHNSNNFKMNIRKKFF